MKPAANNSLERTNPRALRFARLLRFAAQLKRSAAMEFIQLNKDQKLGLKIVLGVAIVLLGFGAFQYPTVRSRKQTIDTQHQMWQIRSLLKEFRSQKKRFPSVNEFNQQFGSIRDAWDNPFTYSPWPIENPQAFRLGSSGDHGVWQHSDLKEYKLNIAWFRAIKNAGIIMSEEGLIQGSDFE